MKRIYVAGKYSDNNIIDCLRNIGRGEKLSAEVFKNGMAPFCPWHDKSYVTDNPDDNFTVKQFYDFSMAWLDVSEAVLLVPGWESSKGTIAEVERAKELGIPVFENIEDLIEWNEF